jgi:MoxR-like ATPase
MDGTPESDAARLREVIRWAGTGLVDRELLAEAVALGAVAGEHLLVVGPPGTAKSEAVRRMAAGLGGRYFEYLLGRFTEPNEVFGPLDLRRLREGVVEVETAGMLPEADVAFLDEVFLGSTAILNTLLGILNERTFARGATRLQVPLRICVAATNTLPADPALAAFADRFLARVFVEPVSDTMLEELLETGWAAEAVRSVPQPDTTGLLEAVDRLAVAARSCDLRAVQPLVGAAVRRLRAAGLAISDRRAVRSQRLVAAAAVLDGRLAATDADLWVLPMIAPTADAQAVARDTLRDLLAASGSRTLAHAAEQLSRGSAARAERLAATGENLLSSLGDADWKAADRDTRLRIEAVLREIDATLAPEHRPERLTEIRGRLAELVRA